MSTFAEKPLTHINIVPLVEKIKILNYFLKISNDFRLVKKNQEKKLKKLYATLFFWPIPYDITG